MTELNQNIKKHTCPTCGGTLKVDMDRQMYECPFCGVTFDYEYFREDDVLARASRALRAGEFMSAREAYDFMLAKEPHNFAALRGKILISANIKSTVALRQPASVRNLHFEAAEKSIDQAIESAEPQHTGYFTKMKELFDTGKAYRDEVRKINETQGERKETYKQIHQYQSMMEADFFEYENPAQKDEKVKYHPKNVIIGSILVYAVWCVLVAIMIGSVNSNSYTGISTSKSTSKKITTTVVRNDDMVYEMVIRSMGLTGEEASRARERLSQSVNMSVIVSDYSSINASKSTSSSRTSTTKKQDSNGEKEFLWALIIIPGIGVLIYIMWGLTKLASVKEYEMMINAAEKNSDNISKKVDEHKKEANRLRIAITDLYKELAALDPMPEAPEASEPAKGTGFLRNRWNE
ncbi:MAG: hypothetical protein IKG93_13170 [Clostridiales bacterium]|nr:hypothetical protein [Clostridiales bacterium]